MGSLGSLGSFGSLVYWVPFGSLGFFWVPCKLAVNQRAAALAPMAAAKLTAWQSKIAGEFELVYGVGKSTRGIYTWGRPVYKRTSGTTGWDVIKWDSLRMHWVPFGTLNLALTLALALESTLTLALALESTLTLALALLLSSLNLTLTPTLTHTRRSMASITLSRR